MGDFPNLQKINLQIKPSVRYLPHFLIFAALISIIIVISICAYIKIKHRFWAIQPCFHIYDLQWYLFPCGIINYPLPEKNRYTNFTNVETTDYSKLSSLKLQQFTNFIRPNYLKNGDNYFHPKLKENIVPYFTGHNTKCSISFYYEDELLLTSGTHTIQNKKIVGVLTTRPVHILFTKTKNQMDVYYLDYLCVDKSRRHKNIAPELMQTHNYNQRYSNKNIQVALFKREGDLSLLVPMCIYKTLCFDMVQWTKPSNLLPIVSLIEVGKTNIHHLFDFFKDYNHVHFDLCIMTDLANILELINTQNIYIYMLIKEEEVIAVYIFKNNCVSLKKGTECLSLTASVNACKNKELFAHGYKVALWKLRESNNAFNCAVIEEVSDNYIITQNLQEKSKPILISPTAYYFYNFAYSTFDSKKVLILI